MSDPYFTPSVAIISFDGTSGSTSVTDYSWPTKIWTANGTAQLSSTQSKFGGTSLHTDGASSYLSTPNSTFWDLSGDFTIEAWVYLTALDSGGVGTILAKRTSGSAIDDAFLLDVDANGPCMQIWTSGATYNATTQSGGALVANTWTHIAGTRSGNTMRCFRDGVLVGSCTVTGGAPQVGVASVLIGKSTSSTTKDWNGYIDDVRVIKGVALYTANFTPPGALDTSAPTIVPALIQSLIPLVQVGAPALTYRALQPAAKLNDVYDGGTGRVSGTTKVKGTPDYAVHRKVRLHRELDGRLIREQWSDPTTGAYSFDNVDATIKYTVVTFDYLHNFRAVIADNLTPDAMP